MLFKEEEVRRGIAWMDEWVPDWRESINRENLDMRNGADCILGQVFGDYDEAVNNNGILDPAFLGFILLDFMADSYTADYQALKETWLALMGEEK